MAYIASQPLAEDPARLEDLAMLVLCMLALFSGFVPRFHPWLVLLSPWMALALAMRGSPPLLAAPTIGNGLLVFPLVCGLPGLMSRVEPILDWTPALRLGVLPGVALGVAVALTGRRVAAPRPRIVILSLLALSYGPGAVLLLNVALDHGQTQVFSTQVRDVRCGRRSGCHYEVAAWGPLTRPHVFAANWRPEQVGFRDTLTMELHSGAFGMPWYRARPATRR